MIHLPLLTRGRSRPRAALRRSLAVLGVAALAAGAVSVSALPAAAATVTPTAKTALINGDSITPDTITKADGSTQSIEQYALARMGFTATTVTGDQWAALTAAQFAKYQLLVVGDPTCNTVPTSATDNAATWTKVVMGKSGLNSTVGNRALVGTDPAYHYVYGGGNAQPTDATNPSTAGAEHLVQSGLTYAGGVAGATGVYFDSSCADDGAVIATMNQLSASGTGFTEDDSPPCGGSVAIVAKVPGFESLRQTDIQGWSCSVHATYPTYPTDWQPVAVATDTTTQPTCGTDPTDGTTACGESYVLVAGRGIVATAPDVALSPTSGSSAVGGSHKVTATVTQDGTPLAGQKLSFTVTGQNAGASGTCVPSGCTTDSTGKVSFTYTDTKGAGDDTITAAGSIGGSTEQATAAWTWVAPANTAPKANAQSVSTAQDTPLPITLTGSDADGDSLTYAIKASPAHGTLSGTAPKVTYTPAAGYSGADSFTFTVNDGKATSTAATVSITVTASATNTPPVADNVGVTTTTNTSVAVKLLGSDADGDPLTYAVGTPAHGALSGTAPNLTYTPAKGYTGDDSFTYTVNDGKATSEPGTVSIDVKAKATGNHAPVAHCEVVVTKSGTAVKITLKGTDADGDALTHSHGAAKHGTLTGSGKTLTYTPKAGFKGLDVFTYTVNDGQKTSAKASVVILVLPKK